MKISAVLLPLAFLAGCSAPDRSAPATDATAAPAVTEAAPASSSATEAPSAASATATGLVESVDVAGKTVTIATDVVETFKWPAMTMTYQAPDIDLSTIQQGDKVSFDLTAVGMDGTITSITRQ